jgi:hypothetical protein
MPDKLVDAFILFNEREEAVASIEARLRKEGISTYFWDRDIPAGEPWAEVEQNMLQIAAVVLLFLGSLGWGPTHLKLASQARDAGKRIIPVLIGDPPADAFDKLEGLFKKLRYVDLRRDEPEAFRLLINALRPARPGQYAVLIGALIDGDEEARATVLREVMDNAALDRRALSQRLREEIENRFGPEQERNFAFAARDPKKMASIRSWMVSVLIWIDAEYAPNRQLIVKLLDRGFETDRLVRFWALAGLFQRRASYLQEAAERCQSDPEREVELLARAILEGDGLIGVLRDLLHSSDFEHDAWPVLRVLRVVPITQLADDLCDILSHSPEEGPLAYDVLYAIANSTMVRAVAPIVKEAPGIERFVDIVIAVVRSSNVGAIRRFAMLLFDIAGEEAEAMLARAVARDPAVAEAVRSLREQLRELSVPIPPESYIPGYASDVVDIRRDDLDIREDVQTLTAIMLAREVRPPLAIGLFGDWGTGKSFFMQSMRAAAERIAASARAARNPKFCTDVIAIEFNAWHYADTNLWASLALHILESLAAEVSPQETAEKRKERLEAEREEARREIVEQQRVKTGLEGEVATRELKLQQLRVEREHKQLAARDLQLSDLGELIEDKRLERELKQALENMGLLAALSSVSDFQQAIADVNSLQGRITAFAVGLFKGSNRWLVLGLLILVLVLPALGHILYQHFADSFVVMGTVVAEIAAFIGGVAALVRKAAEYVRQHVAVVEDAKRKVDQVLAQKRAVLSPEEVTLQREIVDLKAQQEQVNSKLRDANEIVASREQDIAVLVESRTLARFLTERTSSEDYRKHLGLISTIRRDFMTLAERMAAGTAGSVRKIERIILYIDDLDRCPAERVVEVLQAVHLLLAYPLFVVVVGVDPRWLAHALSATYGAFEGGAAAGGEVELWRTTPQNYLEKIFQIPFSLRPMTAGGYGRLVRRLLAPGEQPRQGPQLVVAPKPFRGPNTAPDSTSHGDEPAPSPAPKPDAERPAAHPPESSVSDVRTHDAAQSEFSIHDEALLIKPVETAFAEQLFTLLPTPRATKRFSNIYRILKAPVGPTRLAAFEGSELAPGTFQVPMLLLALVVGMPREAEILFPSLFDRLKDGRDPIAELGALDRLGLRNDDVPPALQAKLSELVRGGTLPRSAEPWLYWIPRVARFSFEIGRGIKPAEPAPSPPLV